MSEIERYLKDLKTRLEPTQNQKDTIKSRLDSLRAILEEDSYFCKPDELTQKTYLHGSYLRNTMIRKSSVEKWDVDIMVIYRQLIPTWMATQYTEEMKKPQSVFNTIKAHLQDKSPLNRLILKQDFPCITISYSSDNLDFEIMPVCYCHPNYHNQDEKMFSIPYTHDHWKEVYPLKFNKDISMFNTLYKGKLVHTIKLLKHWNNSNGKLMTSFLIEKLALTDFIMWARYSEDNLGLLLKAYIKEFFDKASHWINNSSFFTPFKPSVLDDDGSYLDYIYEERPNLRNTLKNNIEIACRLLATDDLDNWKKIFPYL